MFLRTVETAFARFQARGEAVALAIVFDRTAPELFKVARHLAPSAADVEDLVQETFLTAIESAASHQRGRPVLPWLLGILANHARAHRRRGRRRPDPERVRGDVTADVHAEVADHELHRELDAALEKLPESYRPVLRLWLTHGLEAHEIATTLERPSGTVRAQVSRGLDLLRRALPPSLAGGAAIAATTGSGFAAVRSHVLGQCGGVTSGFASTIAIGGLLMMHHKLIAAGTACAIALLSWFVIGFAAGAEPRSPDAGSTSVARSAGGVDSPVTATVDSVAQRDAVELSGNGSESAAPEAPAAEVTAVLVLLRSAATGDPIPGYGVALRSAATITNLALVPRFTLTDAMGSVRFEGVEPGQFLVEIDRCGAVGSVEAGSGTTTTRIIELPDSVTVEGEVVDTFGVPVAGADIVAQGSRLASPRVAVTDRFGRFTVSHCNAVELQARKPGLGPSLARYVAGEPGQRVTMRLQLGAGGRRIAGQVFDAAGDPVAAATVAVIAEAARQITPWDRDEPQPRPVWLRTDREGRFATDEIAAGRYLLVARAPDLDVAPSWAEADVTTADAFVELRSEPATVIAGSVRRSGEPLAGVRISVWPEKCAADIGYLINLIGMRYAVTAADGTFRVVGTMPGELEMRASDGATILGSERRTVAAGDTVRWHLELAAGNALAIEVTAPRPLPAPLFAFVHDKPLTGSAPGMVLVPPDGKASHERRGGGAVDVVLCLLAGGRNMVQLARREAQATESVVRFELSEQELPSRMLRGRLVDATQAAIGGESVILRRTGSDLVVLLESTTADDGGFEFGPLPAGAFEIAVGNLRRNLVVGRAQVAAWDEDVGALVVTK